ncbi:MAG TPA: ROK family protein, partial [Chitinophagaceae bacterium]|nr:ROK family protein [Chitinophagaceae bacterium]
ITSRRIDPSGSEAQVMEEVFNFTDRLVSSSVTAIGIGVPGLATDGVVYDVVNIPAWKRVPLQSLMQERYQLPVLVNNDANCFALGEFYFGKGRGYGSMLGLTIGTGLGSGIIINKKLYAGNNCGAGEFGMMEYLDQCYEYYASGQFFQNVYGISGETVFEEAAAGSPVALKMYEEMGTHLGNAIKAILYALDIELIVLGGSVRHAFTYFSEAMWKRIQTFAYTRALQSLKIEVSELQNSGILGAAALHYDHA